MKMNSTKESDSLQESQNPPNPPNQEGRSPGEQSSLEGVTPSLIPSTDPMHVTRYTFQTLCDFVTELHECFHSYTGTIYRALKLYHRLLSSTRFQDDEMIQRHVDACRTFCQRNRTCIERDAPLVVPRLMFSNAIYIDVTKLMAQSDTETQQTIRTYLLTLSALVDPQSRAKELLQQTSTPTPSHDLFGQSEQSGSEENFLAGLMSQFGSQAFAGMAGMGGLGENGSMNPMEMIQQLMGSGMINQMMDSMSSKIDSGELDLNKMMGAMQGVVQSVQSQLSESDDPLIRQMMSMFNLDAFMPTQETSESKTDTSQEDSTPSANPM
jgi:hypothetical protein